MGQLTPPCHLYKVMTPCRTSPNFNLSRGLISHSNWKHLSGCTEPLKVQQVGFRKDLLARRNVTFIIIFSPETKNHLFSWHWDKPFISKGSRSSFCNDNNRQTKTQMELDIPLIFLLNAAAHTQINGMTHVLFKRSGGINFFLKMRSCSLPWRTLIVNLQQIRQNSLQLCEHVRWLVYNPQSWQWAVNRQEAVCHQQPQKPYSFTGIQRYSWNKKNSGISHMFQLENAIFGIRPIRNIPNGICCSHDLYQIQNIFIFQIMLES